ncbi:hypothetical protein TNCV_2013051 [Trichonephila clavipes]|nr:hypothetical protein TNCV_2013051 [Trichonephila clavipes]
MNNGPAHSVQHLEALILTVILSAEGVSVTLFGTRTYYTNWLRQKSREISAQKDYESSIECSDKQASVSQEVKKVVTITKPFSKTGRTCYASGVRGEPLVPFIVTQCSTKSTDTPYVDLEMYIGESSAKALQLSITVDKRRIIYVNEIF